MRNLKRCIKSKRIIFSVLVILIGLIYLNRSYSYIYEKIDEVGFQSSIVQEEYLINNNSMDSLVYVALGDSLTAGVGVEDYKQSYPYILAQKISDNKTNVTLKPIAIPGARTSNIANSLIDEVIESDADIITVLSGVNDVYGNVPSDEFEQDYRDLIESLISKTGAKIYIINLPYIGDSSLILPPYNYYFEYKTKHFNKIIKEIAVENNVMYIDLYTQAKIFEKDEKYYSLDIFHPSEKGYLKWADSIYENINK